MLKFLLLLDFIQFLHLIGLEFTSQSCTILHTFHKGLRRSGRGEIGEGTVVRVLTWPLAGSRPPGAVEAVCLLRPLGPEPLPHLPPKTHAHTRTYTHTIMTAIAQSDAQKQKNNCVFSLKSPDQVLHFLLHSH